MSSSVCKKLNKMPNKLLEAYVFILTFIYVLMYFVRWEFLNKISDTWMKKIFLKVMKILQNRSNNGLKNNSSQYVYRIVMPCE